MRFVHGSKQKLDKFKMFNYIKDSENKIDSEHVDNGIDAQGPGVYCLCIDEPEQQKRAIEYAERYAGKEGYLYFFSVDSSPEEMHNEIDAEDMDRDQWKIVIEEIIDEYRRGATEERFNQLLYDFESRIEDKEDISLEELENAFEDYQIDVSDYDPSDYDNAFSWSDKMREAFALSDPASFIYDEGGPEAIVDYAINSSYTGWEMLKKVWNAIAVNETGSGVETNNGAFYIAVSKVFKDRTPVGAYIEEEDFHVIFDIDAISIDKVVEMSPKKQELSY